MRHHHRPLPGRGPQVERTDSGTKRMIVLALCGAVLVVTLVRTLPAAGSTDRGDLSEANYLARCSESGWRDAELYDRLMASTKDLDRRAFYAMKRGPVVAAGFFGPPLFTSSEPEDWRESNRVQLEGVNAQLEALKDGVVLPSAAMLRSGSPAKLMTAGRALGALARGDAEVNLTVLALNNPSVSARAGAVIGLWRTEEPAVASRLVPFVAMRVLVDPERRVKSTGAQALGHLVGESFPLDEGSPGEQTVAAATAWIKQHYDLAGLDPDQPAAKADAAPENGKASLTEPFYLARCAAAGWTDGDSYERLMVCVKDEGRKVYYIMNWMFGCLAATEAEPPPIARSDWAQRNEQLKLLVERAQKGLSFADDWQSHPARDLPKAERDRLFYAWVTAVGSARVSERQMAARALSQLGDRKEIVDLLILLLNDEDTYVRSTAALALGDLDATEASREAVPFLVIHALRDGDRQTAASSAEAVRRLTGAGFRSSDLGVDEESVAPAREWIKKHYDVSILEQGQAAPASQAPADSSK